MLSQTKEQIQALVNKVQVLDFTLDTLTRVHKDQVTKVDELVARASSHKLKLVEEILRLSNAQEITSLIDSKEIA